MSWNYRLLAHTYHTGEIEFKIHEVYYDKKGLPDSYNGISSIIYGDSIDEIKAMMKRMKECLGKPILYYGNRFPEEYKPNKK